MTTSTVKLHISKQVLSHISYLLLDQSNDFPSLLEKTCYNKTLIFLSSLHHLGEAPAPPDNSVKHLFLEVKKKGPGYTEDVHVAEEF